MRPSSATLTSSSRLITRRFLTTTTTTPTITFKSAATSTFPTTTKTNIINTTTRHFTTTTPAKMSSTFLDLIRARRTIYALNKDLPVPASRIDEIVRECILHVPTSFNSQSTRAVVLHGAEHDKFWDAAIAVLKAIVPAEKFPSTEARLLGFKAGAGSVLFFEDQEVVKGLEAKMPIYAERFGPWATQADGMAQFAVWTALEQEAVGANLQHYNPLVDEKVREFWGVPEGWKLNAQLVFGGKGGEAGKKEFVPIEERFKSFGA